MLHIGTTDIHSRSDVAHYLDLPHCAVQYIVQDRDNAEAFSVVWRNDQEFRVAACLMSFGTPSAEMAINWPLGFTPVGHHPHR